MTSEVGAYFKDIYRDLVNRLPLFPSDDQPPNLQDCIKPDYVNFVRAEVLAKSHNLPDDIITHLQELSLNQYFRDYDNFEGFDKLIKEYKITQKERTRIGLLILECRDNYPCFHFTQHTLESIDENQAERYFGVGVFQTFKGTKETKPNFISRFISWLKGLFKKK